MAYVRVLAPIQPPLLAGGSAQGTRCGPVHLRTGRRPLGWAPVLLAALLLLAAAAGCGSSSPACSSGCGGATGTGGADSGPSTFPCKTTTCTVGKEACTVSTHPELNDPMGACTALPAACQEASADCTCFGDLKGCMCQKDPSGTFAIFCNLSM